MYYLRQSGGVVIAFITESAKCAVESLKDMDEFQVSIEDIIYQYMIFG